MQLVHRDVLVVGVRDVYRPWPEQRWRAPTRQQWNVCRVGKDGRLEPGERVHPHCGNIQHLLYPDERFNDPECCTHRSALTDDSKHDLRRRTWRDDIWSDAPFNQSDGVVRASEHW